MKIAEKPKSTSYFLFLSLAALGIVYGDIGTSPLYAIRESFHPEHGIRVTPENILGILSLVFWSLVLVISVKYAWLILRADNRGEGGILALTALVTPVTAQGGGRKALVLLGIFGTALLYGDGMLTPAISVLSAVEGLEVATPFFTPYIVPITIVILVLLFSFQRRGTAGVGKVFGPITIAWFLTLAALGVYRIIDAPEVFAAINPLYAVRFFLENGFSGFLALGSVFLVVTGGEALYADLGHLGKNPIRFAWFVLVLPALLLNYFGQGAFLLKYPEQVSQSFYYMAPSWALYPVVILATLATVIASQALITGAFSLTMQAVQLGYVPRVQIGHTSAEEKGQIYIASINWMLMLSCIGLVLGFGSSSKMANAYGVAVITTMVITSLLFFVVLRERWRLRLPLALLVAGFFLIIDLSFWGANLFKVLSGGWFPLLIGLVGFTLMTTWKRGRQLLGKRILDKIIPIQHFFEEVARQKPARVPGTAVFMYSNLSGAPLALLTSLRHYKVLHEKIILLTVQTQDIPHLPENNRPQAAQPFRTPEPQAKSEANPTTMERIEIRKLQGEGFYQVILRYGFMEQPDVPKALQELTIEDWTLKSQELTYFLGRETLLATERPGMALWRERLFSFMSRNARSATDFFRLPPDRVVELGAQIEL